MKKAISLILSIVVTLTSLVVFADGGGVSIGDITGETLFAGSASSHYLLLSSNGVLSAWGDNQYGQCGSNADDETSGVNYINFENKIKKVAAGNDFSIALDENNTAWGWGNNVRFQLGLSRPTAPGAPTQFDSPKKISENITDIAAGNNFSVLLTQDGKVLFSGMGNADTLKAFDFPLINSQVPKIKLVAANYNNMVAVSDDNIVFYYNADANSTEIIELQNVDEVQSAVVGKDHIVLRCLNGENIEFYTYGENSRNQLGVPDAEATTPVLALSFLCEENQHINEFAGAYDTTVTVWNNLSENDKITEYHWGTNCRILENDGTVSEETISTPKERSESFQLVSVGEKQNIAFDFISNTILLFGTDSGLVKIPLIEAADPVETMFEYQYKALPYHTYNVNFVKLNKDAFNNDAENYEHWEFVNENQFRVKVKSFINGIGYSKFNPAISTVLLSKEITGENRMIGSYGPSVWNFNTKDELFKTDNIAIEHGNEDATEFTVSAFEIKNRQEVPLDIPEDVKVFYENPGEITEKTKLGLYLYGLPKETTGSISDIKNNTFKVTLSGNSLSDMDYDTDIMICYIRTSENTTGEAIGDYNLNEVSVFAKARKISGATIKSSENTPEILTVSGSLTKGKENGRSIKVSIAGGEFAESLLSEFWTVLGLDDVTVDSVERIDDYNVKLTLTGNSKDKYTNAELKIGCDASQYTDNRIYNADTGNYDVCNLTTENSITVEKQSRGGSGSSGSSSVSKPVASVPSSEVLKGTKIELSCPTKGAKIYYTVDGTQPTAESQLYQSPIEITENMTLRFIAVLGTKKSAVQTMTYTLKKADIALKKNASTIRYIAASDDMFYPDDAMVRYEILSALNKLFDIENIGQKSTFSDVTDAYAEVVDLFVGADIIEGYPDNTFRGESGITRAEFVKILSIMLDVKEENKATFNDISGHWCEKYINSFAALKLLNGYPDGSFKPDNVITRAEVIAVLNRITQNDNSDDAVRFKDMDESHWAYHDVCKAIIR